MSKLQRLSVLGLLVVLMATTLTVPVMAKKDVIRLWTYPVHKQYDQELAELLAKFHAQNPGVEVQVEVLSWAEGPQKFEVALNAGDPPDVYWWKLDAKYPKTGLMVPLDNYLSAEERADLLSVGLKGYTLDGKLWGIPLYVFIYTLGGNRELLDQANIDWRKIQRDGWTWDEFLDATKKLTRKLPDGRTQYGFVMPGYNSELLEMLMLNNGATDLVLPNGKLAWSQTKIAEAFTLIRKLMDNGMMPKECSGMSAGRRWELFNTWDTAMFGRGIPYFEVMSIQRAKDIADGTIAGKPINYVSLPFPYRAGQSPRTYGGSEGYCLFKQKKYQGEQHTANAAELLKFLTGPEAGAGACELAYPPVSSKGREMFKANLAALNPANVEFTVRQTQLINWRKPLPLDLAAKESRIISEAVLPIFQAVMAYEMSPEDAAAALIQRAERVLSR